jgi:hypothetical protein
MKQLIKFNNIGRIKQGAYEDWYVLVEDDTENTGGYYIFISDNPNVKGVTDVYDGAIRYDAWLENQEQIESYFERSQWIIEWK